MKNARELALAAAAVTAFVAGSAAYAHGSTARIGSHGTPSPRSTSPTIGSCTMAVPGLEATIEAQIASEVDFCELASQALADDVFRAPVAVTPGQLWHYADAFVSCRLEYGDTRELLTIRNSSRACRWFTRAGTGWHPEVAPLL